MCVEYFGCCFDYFLQLLDSDWHLSDNGHDDGNCGKSYSSACETLDCLLGLFYNTSYKSSLSLSGGHRHQSNYQHTDLLVMSLMFQFFPYKEVAKTSMSQNEITF